MKTQTKTSIRSRLIRPLLIGALCVAPLAVRATPYATSLTNNGPGTSITFRLNESGIVTVIWTNNSGNFVTNNFGNRVAGLITTNMSGGGGPVPGNFSVTIAKTNTPGYLSGVALQISTDAITNGAALSTNVMKFNNPRGVTVNTNPASGHFGRIYVANSAAGAAAPRAAVGDGIYLINADFTDAVGQLNAARTGGITTFTNAIETDGSVNSPWRLSIGEDNNLYIADFSSNTPAIYVADPDVLVGAKVLSSNGRIGSGVIAKGSTNAGNLVLYALDSDATLTSDLFGNHITTWSVGSGPFPTNAVGTNVDNRTLLVNAGITADMEQGPDGKFYTMQNRSDGNEGGVFVVDTTVDGGPFFPTPDGLWDGIYDSRADSIVNHANGTTDLLRQSRAIAISPDGKFMAVARDDANTWIIPLTNGIPNLGQRRLVATGGTVLGRDVAFDAAGNLYVAASGNAALRVYSPGYNTIATTTWTPTGSTFSVTNITPNQFVAINGAAFTGAVTNATEGSVDGIVNFSRTGDTGVPLTVTYVLSGTANRGGDYVTNSAFGAGATNTLIFGAGVDNTNVTVALVDDGVGEGVETITFTLLSSTNYVTSYNVPTTVYITDDGIDLPGVSITARGLGSYELLPSRPAKFTASLGTPFGSDVTVTVSLAGSTAVSGTDFSNPNSFTVTIPAGSLNTVFTVTPIDNAAIAADKLIIASMDAGAAYTNTGVTIATNTLRNDDYAALSSLYSESFDIDNTANWVVKFATNNDVATDFFFDYSTVGVPVAPRTVGGTTRGLRLKTHLTLASARIGVSVAPTNQAFSGNYRLRFDSWFNFAGPIDSTGLGSTEIFLAGVGASENRTNGPFAAVQTPLGMGPAVSFSYSADGGYGVGSGIRDIVAYTNTVAIEAAIGGVYLAGTNTAARENGSSYYAEFGDLTAPAAQLVVLPGQTRTNGVGVMGMCWHDVIIDKTSTNVTWTVDGLLIANVPTAVFYSTMGSNIFFGMDDSFTGSIATPGAAQFALVDNVSVEQLPASANASLTSLVLTPAGTLNPAFASGTTTYAATNNFVANPVTITAVRSDPAASLQLKVNAGAFGPLTSGVASAGQTLNAGQNTVVVRVTAMDATTQDYTVNAVLRPSGSVPTVTSSVSGSTLTLGWPSTHLGYELQTQTNSASTGLGSTWFTVPGSTSTNSINLNIDPANPTVFFRLLYMFP